MIAGFDRHLAHGISRTGKGIVVIPFRQKIAGLRAAPDHDFPAHRRAQAHQMTTKTGCLAPLHRVRRRDVKPRGLRQQPVQA